MRKSIKLSKVDKKNLDNSSFTVSYAADIQITCWMICSVADCETRITETLINIYNFIKFHWRSSEKITKKVYKAMLRIVGYLLITISYFQKVKR